jgi:hypothetical protein
MISTKECKMIIEKDLPVIYEAPTDKTNKFAEGVNRLVAKPQSIGWVKDSGKIKAFDLETFWTILGNEGYLRVEWDEEQDAPLFHRNKVIIHLDFHK